MDSRLAVRPIGAGMQASVVRPDAAPLRGAVPTDLSAAQTVTAAVSTAHTSNDMTRAPGGDPSRLGDAILDPHSREVLYRAADVRTRRIVRQMPEVAARRLKAYARPVKDDASPDDAHADIEI